MAADGPIIGASHNHVLVALSVVISVLGSYAARALSGRVREASGWVAAAWLAGYATADGIGTWSMHYTGMLALRLPVPILFDWPMVLLSLLVCVGGSALSLLVLGRGPAGWPRVVLSGVILGAVGISGLHYTAMEAMRLPGMHHHYQSPPLVALSVVLAAAISVLALALNFRALAAPDREGRFHCCAVVRGLANPVMHYTAMAAVVFVPTDEVIDVTDAVPVEALGVLGICVVPVTLLIAALLTSLVGTVRTQGARLDELFQQAPQAVALLTADTRVVRVNREFVRMFGYRPDEAVGRKLRDLIVPDEAQDQERSHIAALARGERVDVDGVRRRKDGSRLHVAILGVPVSVPGGQIEIYAMYRDMTERIRAERERQRQAEILTTIFDHIPVVISFVDPAVRVELVNRHWERLLGWSAEETRTADIPALLHTDPAERRASAAYIRNPPHGWTECRAQARDGRTLYIAWTRVVLSEGTQIWFGMDVTDQRHARQALEQSAEQLRALSRRLFEVQETEHRHLARELHDEYGQLLTGLRLLLKPNAHPDSYATRVEQARGLVDELLGRVQALSFELRPAALDQLGLLPALLALFERYTGQTGVRVDFKHQGIDRRFPPEVETAAYRVVQEALTNAARHAAVPCVTVRVWATPEVLNAQVEDRGRGFDPETALATPRSSGLAGMRERVGLLGGELTIESSPGGGTQVTAGLPLAGGGER